ncbi:Tetratricopeptide repeat protein [Rubripirellula tenax]|uniref:Tetratricopeptide repeat protein n=1 Tax=Rubripirellula tenax TaxID=2528015 RepID=A0A5C6EC26_9BACT|nr:tetratricopeptide repeat protein [Rubripirellula tenax]TWU47333.1 Tetratricopeptide repeat protein [Rubripirellula tenax]
MPDGFAGSDQCVECHRDRYESYRLTDHSRSLRFPDLDEEVVDVSYRHDRSSRSHRVTRQGNQLIHDIVLSIGNEELLVDSKPIDWVVGSGAFGKSYLINEADGCVQAPLTYYTQKHSYEMSPGFDIVDPVDFQRQISDECLFCHAGILSREDNNELKFTVYEMAIGCERCHGPGDAHVQLFRQRDKSGHPLASTMIVNPASLDRDRIQSICAQCHLQGDVTLQKPGTDAWSFRPGNLLSDTKSEYAVGKESDNAFVGHFSQLEASACYMNSATMSCVTCHDPHHSDASAGTVDDKRAKRLEQNCVQCHQENECGVTLRDRIDRADNRCVTCHMPRGESEVPHADITNHRIAVYEATDVLNGGGEVIAEAQFANSQLPNPRALLDSTVPESSDRKLNEALAMGEWWLNKAPATVMTTENWTTVMDDLRRAISKEPNPSNEAAIILARLIHEQLLEAGDEMDSDRQLLLWREAVGLATPIEKAGEATAYMRSEALAILADAAYEFGQNEESALRYERVVSIRRVASDWYNLGLVYGRLRQFEKAEFALQKAILLNPVYAKPHRSLGRLYENVDPASAFELNRRADLLDRRFVLP